jgi:hypothetical protein
MYETYNLSGWGGDYGTTGSSSLFGGDMSGFSSAFSFLQFGMSLQDAVEEFFTGSTEEERWTIDQELFELEYQFAELGYQAKMIDKQIELYEEGISNIVKESRAEINKGTAQTNVVSATGGMGGSTASAPGAAVSNEVTRAKYYAIDEIKAQIEALNMEKAWMKEQEGFLSEYEDQLSYQRLSTIDKWLAGSGGFQPWGMDEEFSESYTNAKARFF